MRCLSCGHEESKVIDSRLTEEGAAIRRRRECLNCGYRFTTYERMGERPIIVEKSDGSQELFDRKKLMRGLMIACAKRPVTHEQIDNIISNIESAILTENNKGMIKSKEIGNMALARLLNLDDVAYIRFASVYKDFQSIDEFANALKEMD